MTTNENDGPSWSLTSQAMAGGEGVPDTQTADDQEDEYNASMQGVLSPSTANDSDDESVLAERAVNHSPISLCEILFLNNGNSMKMIMAMAKGLKGDNGIMLVRLNEEPYKSSKQRASFLPKKNDYQQEVMRRVSLFNLKEARCNAWTISALSDYLNNHPIVEAADVAFLAKTLKHFENLLTQASVERDTLVSNRQSTGVTSHWKPVTHMRLFHAMTEDSVRETFLHRHDIGDRTVLDGRNSEERPPTYEEAVAAQFNDITYCPLSLSIPHLHDDFAESLQLHFDDAIGEITPDQIKSRFADVKAKAVLVSTTTYIWKSHCGSSCSTSLVCSLCHITSFIDDRQLGKKWERSQQPQ